MQSGGEVKQLGLIFMSEADANALVEKVGLQYKQQLVPDAPSLIRCHHTELAGALPRQCSGVIMRLAARACITGAQRMQVRDQNPKLAKQSRVLKVSMDNVYDFAVTPEVDKKTEGVSFRFMPDMNQVQKALEV